MTYDIDITIIKQFAILMDMNDAILASWIFNYDMLFNYKMLKCHSVMYYCDKHPKIRDILLMIVYYWYDLNSSIKIKMI